MEAMTSEREAFEKWYVENAFDYERNPLGSRDCGLQWKAWQAARLGLFGEDAVERLAQFIVAKESRNCKTLDEALFHRSTWRRVIPEAREMLEAAHLAQPAQAVDVGAARLQARADEIERAVGDGWISVDDRLPEPCQFVLASYLNTNGKGRVIRAMYAAPRTLELHMDAEGGEYDEETDTYWCEPGWYEANDNEEIHWFVAEKVTHWMPLPASPTPDKEGA